jgi:hypothetical protein
MRAGDRIRVRVSGEAKEARVLRILDRRGRELPSVNLADPPPYTTLVLDIEGLGHRPVCVPLWVEVPHLELALVA